jgi:transposase-like protein
MDEMCQNAGEKGKKRDDPEDQPRHRGNKARGHGTWDTDRPPVVGAVGRVSGNVRLAVVHYSRRADLEPLALSWTKPGATINTDEWGARNHLSGNNRDHEQVCHKPGERIWAADLDGDGVNEAHTNTIEGFWTGLRNFLRPFRGVSKVYLQQYCSVFQWRHNLKTTTNQFLRTLLGYTQLRT